MPNKLEGFGPIYIVNLKRRVDRREALTAELLKYGVTDFTFIEAIDAEEAVLPSVQNMKPAEVACTLSHVEAIKYWLTTNNNELAIIIEDDFSLDTVPYWGFSWTEFLKSMPNYDALQLSIFNVPENLEFGPHIRKRSDSSASAYVLTRRYAKKLVENKEIRHAESFLFNLGNVYSFALFTHNKESLSFSDINPEHVIVQALFREKVLNYWQEGGWRMSDDINPDLFEEDFEEDFEDGFEDFDFDEDDLDDLEDLLADDEPQA